MSATENLIGLQRAAADARRRLEDLARRLADLRLRLAPAAAGVADSPPAPFAGSEPGAIENLELTFEAVVDVDPEKGP